MNRKNNKGFSLVELLVVITIIAILSVTAYVALSGQTEKARNARRAQDISTIQSALEIYYIEHNNQYPPTLDELTPKYMPKKALDPSTNEPYAYAKSNSNKQYQLGATFEFEDEQIAPYGLKAFLAGNGNDLLSGKLASDGTSACSPVAEDDTTCVPYTL